MSEADACTQIQIVFASSSEILSRRQSQSFVVHGNSWLAMCCASSLVLLLFWYTGMPTDRKLYVADQRFLNLPTEPNQQLALSAERTLANHGQLSLRYAS